MGMLSGSTSTCARPLRLICMLALPFLSGCATTHSAEVAQPSSVEAVEVGYGIISQDDIVGSVSTEYGDEDEISRPRTMAEMLARLPGVVVKQSLDGGVSVSIRGAGARFFVDGMRFRGSVNSINPNTVESISILKNAGEMAAYGGQVGHGSIILIKTKGVG